MKLTDATGGATLVLTPASIAEGASTAVTATLSGASSEAVTLTVAAAPGTDTAAGDFTLTGTTLTVAAGATASTGTVTIAATDNEVDDADRQVTVSARVTGGHGVAAPADVTLAITDDDDAPSALPVVTVSGDGPVTEGAGAVFTVSRTGDAAVALTVLLTVSEDETEGRDFVAADDEGNKQVVIRAGSATAAFTAPTTGDATDEPDGDGDGRPARGRRLRHRRSVLGHGGGGRR